MNMATLTNAPRVFAVAGRTFLVSALTQREWGYHQAWIMDHVPRPPVPDGLDNIDRAAHRRAWPPAIGSRIWWDAIDHPGCFPALVGLALGKHATAKDMPDEEALALAGLICAEEKALELVFRCLGSEVEPGELAEKAIQVHKVDEDEEDSPIGLPESDDPGDVYFRMVGRGGLSYADVIDLTFPQIRYLSYRGKPPARNTRRYSSTAAARSGKP